MNAIDMVIAFYRLCYAFGLLFMYCEMGEQISGAFGEIEDEMYEMDWHLYPIKTQKIMLIILINAQQPVEFMGFGNFPANRETMQRVNSTQIIGFSHKINNKLLIYLQVENAGFSYFMIVREFL